MSDFNAQQARGKRPCPIWVDAFQRDTQHLSADEFGAYFLILMAMWTRESCDFPDDDNRLARVSRVSTRLWRSRIGPALRGFFQSIDGALISKRLRQEAAFTEEALQKQSDRKRGTYAKPQGVRNSSEENDEKSRKSLNNNKQASSTDNTTDEPRNYPTQQPNNLHTAAQYSAREDFPDDPTHRERLLTAAGADPVSGIIGPNGTVLGKVSDMERAKRWSKLGLSIETQCAVIKEAIDRKKDTDQFFVPRSFAYFDGAMDDAAQAGSRPRKGGKPSEKESRLDYLRRAAGQN